MPKIALDVVGQAYKMPSIQLDAQTCINWYPIIDPTGKFPKSLAPTDGLTTFTNISAANQIRGTFELNDVLYVVAGDSFYIVDNNGNYDSKGTLKTSVGNVRMVPNDNQIFITDGVDGYVYQLVKSATREAGDFFVIENASSFIGGATFTGAGLDDMTSGGTYIGATSKNYRVEIDATGTPDTFQWSDSKGETWNGTGVVITGTAQTLNDGVTVTFTHTTGHALHDRWDFSTSTDSAFYVPVIPAYQDGYGIYIKEVSNRFYISAIDDFSLVNALDFAKENAWPDNLVAAISIKEELWLIGRTTSRVWYDTGAAEFPFEPRTNLLIKYGTRAPYSVAVGHDNLLLWIGNNTDGGRIVIIVEGYTPQIISTEALNAELDSYETVDDAIGFVYQRNGHIFYCLIFPTADRSWVFDLTTKEWHERRSTFASDLPSSSQWRQGRWRANNYVHYQGKHLVGDFESGKIYKLDATSYTEDGVRIQRERTTKVLSESLHRICAFSFEVNMQRGTGLTVQTDQGHDPQMMLQISTDDAVTWGNEQWRSLGKTGKYKLRAKWNRLGESDSFVFRIRTSDPIYTVLLGAVIDVEDTGT